MPFISTPEHVGEERGLRKSIESVLRVRFGPEGLKLMPEINQVFGENTLSAIHEALLTATNLDDVRRIWASQAKK